MWCDVQWGCDHHNIEIHLICEHKIENLFPFSVFPGQPGSCLSVQLRVSTWPVCKVVNQVFDNIFVGVYSVPLDDFRVNVGCGPAEERLLLTGLHAVADIYCENCHTTLGWKYVSTPLTHSEALIQGVCRSCTTMVLIWMMLIVQKVFSFLEWQLWK